MKQKMHLKIPLLFFKQKVLPVITGKPRSKTLRNMKLTAVILLLATMQVGASSYAQKVSLTKRNASLVDVLKEIRNQTGYYFIYTNEVLEHVKTININVKDKDLNEALKDLLTGHGLKYSIKDQSVILKVDDTKNQQNDVITVRGKIVGSDDNQPVIGASIMVAGNKSLGTTDVNGNFNFKINKGTEVTFSSIGFVAVKRTFVNNENNVTIALKVDNKLLGEVVVTALGIKREEKALGYSVTQVSGEQLTEALSNNWTDALTGKVAGLNLIKSGGGPAGSNKIVLRGENSLDGGSEALIVVDGVVTSSSSGRATGGGSGAYLSGDSPTDFGTGLADINPEDIESVSVLKGPAATALYGARGGNGAVIITTKSGKINQKGLGISFNSNSSFDAVNNWPDFQNEYGQGAEGQDLYYSYNSSEDGGSTRSTSSAWGPKFEGQKYYQYDPTTRTKGEVRTPWVPYPDNRKDFFQVGSTYTNSLSFEGGTQKTTARLSLTNVSNKWIIPNTGYGRNTIALSVNNKLSDKLIIAAKVNYTNKFSDNLPSTGYNNQSIMYFIRGMTPNMDIDWFKDYWVPGREGIEQTRPFSSLLDNPYLIANEMLNKSDRNQVTGNVSATYNFTKKLSLMIRSSVDFSYEERSQQRPMGTNKFVEGMYRTQNIQNKETNLDFLGRYNDKINDRIDYSLTLGGSTISNKYIKDEVRADKLLYPNEYSFANSKNLLVTLPYKSRYKVNSFYGLGSFNLDKYLYLDLTARSDWTSVLATPVSVKNTGFFYYSAGLSAVLSEKLNLPSKIDFLKVRASYAEVGSGTTKPYRTAYAYTSSQFEGSLQNPTLLPNSNLLPLRTLAYEFGTDIRMFKSRLTFDAAVYQNRTKDQIIESPVDRASGYSAAVLNIGEVENTGVELQINGTPIKVKNGLKWDIYGNFSYNENKVISLHDSISTYIISTGPRGTVEARKGMVMGGIYGLGYERSPDGQIVYDATTGLPILSQTAKYLGRTTAPYKAGLGTSFSYKEFRLNILFDGQFGGVAYSLTHSVLAEEGKLTKTIPGRYNGITGDGVVLSNGSYIPNTTVAASARAYYFAHYQRDNVESNIFSTDFVKFREARLDYTLKKKMLAKLGLQRATIGVYGRNLMVFSNWPSYDPEFGTIGPDGDISAGFEVAQFPSTRTFGINLSIGI